MKIQKALCMILSATALTTLSCAAPGEHAPTLHPRPVELRLDGIADACSMLTSDQLENLNVSRGSSDQLAFQSGLNKGPTCGWPSITLRPPTSYGVTLVLNHGAAVSQGIEPPRLISGFSGILTAARGFDRNYNCGIMIDVAPDQALMAGFDNPTQDYPGMNRQLACDKAQQLAEMLLANLRARLGK